MKKTVSLLLIALLLAALVPFTSVQAQVDDLELFQTARAANGSRLWYDQPTTVGERSTPMGDNGDWQNLCLPLGNGYMGAMLAGQLQNEKIQFNEKTLWTGGPSTSRPNYNGGNYTNRSGYLQTVHDEFLAGNDAAAIDTAKRYLVGQSSGYGSYQNFGWMDITHKYDGEAFDASAVSNYARDLDLETGTGSVSFQYKGVGYIREYFMSYPDHVMVMKQTATEGGKLNMDVSFSASQSGASITAEGDTVTMKGALSDNQMRYESQLKVIPEGGSYSASGSAISVTGANSVVVIMSAATDYKNEYPTYRSGVDPHEVVAEYINAATEKGYDALYERHQADYGELFSRVAIDLGHERSGKTTSALLADYKAGRTSRELEQLLFQYGRYMTIASSRIGSLPSNLQGVWNETNNPPWGSDYHINVNLQMNYWPTYSSNLAECAVPLIDYVDSFREPGRITAKEYMGIESTPEDPEKGFTAHTQNTPFGWTCPGWDFTWGWSPAAVPWLLQNVWEYYEYTGDLEYMRTNIYPMMREQSRFWQEYLVLNPEDGMYYSAPAYSPEHGPITLGNVYEHVLVKQLLTDTIEASRLLGTDEELRAEWQYLADHIRTEEIGDDGQLKEWFEETTIGSVPDYQANHRHLSHTLGLYPGDSINVDTPELLEATVVSLNSGRSTTYGWGISQRINVWARIQNGEQAYNHVKQLLNTRIHDNLFDAHPPFQIDGNFGYTAGVTEMLLQSNLGYIQPLPAIPQAWAQGSVNGLMARGNFEVDMQWSDRVLDEMQVLSNNGGECVVKYAGLGNSARVTAGGTAHSFTRVDDDTIRFNTEAGGRYSVVLDAPKPVDAPQNVQAYINSKTSAKVTWSAVAAATYDVYRKVDEGEFEKINEAPVAELYFVDTEAPVKQTVQYYVVALREGVQSAPSETANMVQLAIGLIDDRDPRVQYVGNWGTWDEAKHHNGTIHFIENSVEGEAVSLLFIGTGIRIIAPTNNHFAIVDIYIDGEKVDTVSLYSASSLAQQTVYENLELPYGEHTISMVSTGTGEGTDNRSKIEFDAFEVLDDSSNLVQAITVSSLTGSQAIGRAGGTMQMLADVAPEEAEDRSIAWSVTETDGSDTTLATIDENGLLTAGNESGVVRVTASAQDGSNVKGSVDVAIYASAVLETFEIVDNKDLAAGTNYIASPGGIQWSEWAESKHYNGSIHYVQGAAGEGAKITYPFTGTGVDVVAPLNSTFGSFQIEIDGEVVDTVELTEAGIPSSGYAQRLIYSNKELSAGKHTITLTLLARDGIVKAEFDYFKIYNTTRLADRSALQQLLEQAETLIAQQETYTEDSFASFMQAVENGVQVMNRAEAAQAEIDEAVTALQNGIEQLRELTVVDKTELEALYNGYKDTVNDNYTEDSWNAFQNALAGAKTVLDNEEATQEQVDDAKQQLQATYDGLAKQPGPGDVEVESVKINLGALTNLKYGKPLQLNVNINPSNATDKTLIFTSSNNNVLTVDANGVVTGLKPGTARVTATAHNGVSHTVTIRVTA